jgi:hypothetical protein
VIIWYRTRSGGGGRGVDDVDRIIVDEAQHATQEQVAAISPTGFANRNPQLNAFGTGGIDGVSRWWWGLRKRAISADPGAFGYVGHTAENVYLNDEGQVTQDPIDASDRKLWPLANPAIVSGRGRMEFLEEQFRNLPDLFAREHLGVWDPPPPDDLADERWAVWSRQTWDAAGTTEDDLDSPGWLVGAPSIAVEVAHDRSAASLVAVGACREGGIGVQVVAHERGIGWILPAVREVCAAREITHVVIDAKSPALTLIEPLREAGVTVHEPSFDDLRVATGHLYDAIGSGQARHRRQPVLTEAVSHAAMRTSGDAWLFDRRTGMDTTAIIGAAVALAGHLASEPEPVPAGFAMILGGS